MTRPDEHDQPDLRKDVQRLPEVPQREQRAGERERHGEQDHERIDEALELRGEHEIDQHAARARTPTRATTSSRTKSRAEPVSAVVKRSSSVARGDLLERGDAVAQRASARERARDGRGRRSGCSDSSSGGELDSVERRSGCRAAPCSAPPTVRTARLPRSVGPRAEIARELADHVVLLAVVDEDIRSAGRSARPAASARCRAR